MHFALSETTRDDVHVVEVAGDLDITSSPAVLRLVKQVFDRGGERLVLDLSGVEFLDSTGISAVIVGKVEAATRNVRFVCVPGESLDLLRRVGLDAVLELADSQTAAVEELRRDAGEDVP